MSKKRRKWEKPSDRSEVPESPAPTPALVPQPHGGALYHGGLPGNNGGRPTNHVRALAKAGLLKALPKVEEIASGDGFKPADTVNATALLHKIAGDDDDWSKHPDVIAFLAAVRMSIMARAPDVAELVIQDVKLALKPGGE